MLAIIMSIENNSDRAFVEDVYNLYAKKMYLIAYDILKNHYDAEDCVQETIIKIIDKIERFKEARDKSYLKKLVVIVCRNIAINKYNQNKRKHQTELSVKEYDDQSEILNSSNAEEDVEKIVLSESNYQYIKQLIDKLDPIYRDVIVLKSMQFSNEEIAQMMNISIDLVRKRYSRARVKILEMGGDALYGC